jgi:hypothetical protein
VPRLPRTLDRSLVRGRGEDAATRTHGLLFSSLPFGRPRLSPSMRANMRSNGLSGSIAMLLSVRSRHRSGRRLFNQCLAALTSGERVADMASGLPPSLKIYRPWNQRRAHIENAPSDRRRPLYRLGCPRRHGNANCFEKLFLPDRRDASSRASDLSPWINPALIAYREVSHPADSPPGRRPNSSSASFTFLTSRARGLQQHAPSNGARAA